VEGLRRPICRLAQEGLSKYINFVATKLSRNRMTSI